MGIPLSAVVALRYAQYKEKKKVKSQDGGETIVYVYSDRQVSNRNREKADRVEGLRKSISDLRAKVKKDLTCEDPHKRLTALAVALMDCTMERVGNHDSAEDGHYGVTGWTADHIKVRGDKATITYVGKSGVDHEKVVESGPTLTALKKALKGKKGTDRLLEDGDVGVDPEDVNAYLKEFDITAKDIRGFRANQEMCKALTEVRKNGPKNLPRDRKEKDKILKAEFKKALETVAEIVGHGASTLKSQYLVPNLEESYVHDGTILKELNKKGSVLVYGTKTQAEKEDDQVADMVNSAPKKKPPRKDLQKHQIVDSDPDTSSEDRDLSLNYKRVASRYLRALEFPTQEDLDAYLKDHPDADPKNHSVKNPKKDDGESDDGDTKGKGDKTPDGSPPKDSDSSGDKKDSGNGDSPKKDAPKPKGDDGSRDLGDLKKGLSVEDARDLQKLHGQVSDGDPDLGRRVVDAIKEESQRAQDDVARALDTGDFRSVVKWLGKEGFSPEKSKKEIETAIRDRDSLHKEIEGAKSQLKKSKKAFQSSQQRRDKALNDLKEAEDVLKTTQKEVDDLLDEESKNTDAVKGRLKKLQKLVQDMQSKYESSEEDLQEAQDDLAKAQETYDGLDDARKELDKANEDIIASVARHHAALSVLAKMTSPLTRKKDEGDGFRHRALDKFEYLPPDIVDTLGGKLESDLAALDKQIQEAGDEVSDDLKSQRQDLADELSALKVSKHLRGEKGLTTGLVKALRKVDPGSNYIFDLAEGPESPKYRKAVHNAMAAMSDDDFVATLEDYAPDRVKDMLGPLKSGVYEDPAKGGRSALSNEQAAFLRQSVVNAILNDADAEGEPGDEVPGSKGGKTPNGPGSSKGKTPWWLLQLMKMRGKKIMAFNHSTIRPSYRMVLPISRNQIMKKKASAEGIRRVVATLDNVATLFQEHHEALGIHPKVAMDMAERCDRVSDFLQKKGQFDASTIGKKVPGPLVNDPSQKFMAGHFTQANFEQLDAKQESGSLASNAAAHKADPKLAALLNKAVKEATLRVLAEMEEGEKESDKSDAAEEKPEDKKEEKKASKSRRAAEDEKKEEDEKAAEADESDEAEKVASLFSLYL